MTFNLTTCNLGLFVFFYVQVSDRYKLVSLCPLLKILDGKVSHDILFLEIDNLEFAWPTLSVFLSLLKFYLMYIILLPSRRQAAHKCS